ncbi:hypothetical protein ACKWTF_016009 [Chironomus riparius]
MNINSALASSALQCTYGSHHYEVVNDIYQCSADVNISITTQDSACISSVTGSHVGTKTNEGVIGFRAVGQNIQFFPLGLQLQFPNIELIHLESCPLKHLHKSDLKDYKSLVYLCIFNSDLSIIEDGIFDNNQQLKLINFGSNKFLNIEPSAFKNLDKLTHFYLHAVPCIVRYTRDRNGVESILNSLVTQCKNPEFLSMHKKFKNLESRSTSEDIKEDLKVLQLEFQSSEFSENPSLKTRLQELKVAKIDNLGTQISSDMQAASFNKGLKFDSCPRTELMFNGIKLQLTDHDSKLVNIQKVIESTQNSTASSIDNIISSINDMKSSLTKAKAELKTDIQASQVTLKASQDIIKSSQDEVISNLSNIKITVSDVESSLSKIKGSQNELQSSINKLRLTQNELGIALDKVGKNEDLDEKLSKIEVVEEHLLDFEVKTSEKFQEIKQDLASRHHKMGVNIEEKIKGIEKRLIKKFEDILEEKLRKILDEKLANIIGDQKLKDT